MYLAGGDVLQDLNLNAGQSWQCKTSAMYPTLETCLAPASLADVKRSRLKVYKNIDNKIEP